VKRLGNPNSAALIEVTIPRIPGPYSEVLFVFKKNLLTKGNCSIPDNKRKTGVFNSINDRLSKFRIF
jgi:hypothetical protein